MARRYRKSYRRKKYYKKDDSFELIFGIIMLGAAAVYINNAGLFPASENPTSLILKALFALVIVSAILFGTLFLIKHVFGKFKRATFYKQQRMLEDLRDLHPKEFENYLAAMFEQQGYSSETTSYQKDNGIDIVLKKDGKKYAVQAKRYNKKNYVGEPAVRDFFGSYAESDFAGGFFVTTSFYSDAAKEWSKTRNIKLIDGEALTKMMNTY